MPYNGIGGFTLVAGNPVVTGTTISSTVQNNTMTDFANGFANCITRDGQSPALSNIPLGGFKLTGLGAGTTNGDAVRWEQVILTSNLADTSSVSNGAALVGRAQQTVDSIAALRLLLKTSASKYAFVTGYYAAGDGGGGEYYYDASDVVSADNGGTIIVAADGGRWKLADSKSLNVLQFGADPTGVADSYTAFVNAFATGKELARNVGTFKIGTSIDLKSNPKPTFRGTGFRDCIINFTGAGYLFDLANPADVIDQTFIFEDFKINCTGANSGITARHRHMYVMRNVPIYGGLEGTRLKDCWIGELENVDYYGGTTPLILDGDVNRLAIRSCRFVNYSGSALIANPGTFGCLAVVLDNCDIEFAGGKGIVWNSFTTLSVKDCYTGDAIFQANFEISAGFIHVDGGVALWGTQASFSHVMVSFPGAAPSDERGILLENMNLGGATYCGPDLAKMISGDGKFGFRNCKLGSTPYWNGSRKLITGNPLLSLPGQNALSGNGLPFAFTGTGGATAATTTTLSTASKRFTITAGGVGSAAFVDTALIAGKLNTFGGIGVIIVYASNADWGVQAVTTVPNGIPTLDITGLGAAGVPNTGGAISTLVCFNQTALAAAYAFLEFFRATPSVNDYIEIYEAYVMDNRQSGSNGSLYALKNLYKPT